MPNQANVLVMQELHVSFPADIQSDKDIASNQPSLDLNNLDSCMHNVIGYVRVSSDVQVEGTSLDSQTEDILKYCKDNDLNLVRIFREEGESGTVLERTEIQNMFEWLESYKGKLKIEALVVHKLDRIARDVLVHFQIFYKLAGLGVGLKSISEPLEDSPTGRCMMTVFAAMAQLENETRKDRTWKGIAHNMKNGKWMFKLPIGYQRIDKIVVRKEPEFSHIQHAFKMIERGEWRITEARIYLEKMGVKGKESKNGLPRETASRLFHNELYTGEFVYKGELVKGRWEPAISKESFEKVLYNLTQNAEKRLYNLRNQKLAESQNA